MIEAVPYALAVVAVAVIGYRFAALWLDRVHPVKVAQLDETRQELELVVARLDKMQRQITSACIAVGMKPNE